MLCCCLVAKLCWLFGDPMDCRLPGSSGIFQARILQWAAISSSRGSSQRKGQTHISCIPCTGRQILYHWANTEAYPIPKASGTFSAIKAHACHHIPWMASYDCLFSEDPQFCPLTARVVPHLATICGLSSVQSLSHVQLFETPLTAARQASLSITNS